MRLIFLLVIALVLKSCAPIDLYERTVNIPKAKWSQSFVPEFTFKIPDSSTGYKVFVVLRHTNRYPVRNMYVNVGIRYGNDSAARIQQFDLQLASGEQWLGNGMDDVFERRIQLFPQAVKFAHSGPVTFTLQQNMRIDPLPEVMQAGISIEPQR